MMSFLAILRNGILYFLLVSLSSLSGKLAAQQLTLSHQQHRKLVRSGQVHLQWQRMGPVVNSARVESVQIDHQRPGTIYVAFGSGGLWKSTNNGISWTPIFENQAAPGIGDIALAPSQPDRIYVGTGESLRKQRNFTMPGNGIYRSDDGGLNWLHVGLEDNWHTGEIAVHPENPDIALVAAMGKFWTRDTTQGIYRTDDAGQHWQKVLSIAHDIRANDVVFAPSNPEIAYASVWANNIDTNLLESVYGPGSGVYRSDDGGQTWKAINNGLPMGPKKGRIGLAVSHQDAAKVYLLIDNINNRRSRAPEIYRSTTGGELWQKTHLDSLKFASIIGWYFSDIYVNPEDDEEIYALGVRVARSSNGGKHFEYLEGQVTHLTPSLAQTLHLDHCELWINPTNPNHLALGNDGGLYTSYDRGASWLHHNNIPTGEFYTITVEQKAPYRILGGTQDDATVIGTTESIWQPGHPDPWRYLWIDAWSGGDGCYSAFDPTDSSTVYLSMQEGATHRLHLPTQSIRRIQPWLPEAHPGQLRFNFVTPYFVSRHTGDLYQAGNYVFKSRDRGDSWSLISEDLGQSAFQAKKSEAAGALVESPRIPGKLYMGTDHGAVWKYEGAQWTEISNNLANGYIRSIAPSHHNDSLLYLTMTGLNYDDLRAYVYRSIDDGASWKLISSNLPEAPCNVILEDPYQDDLLFLGTMRGTYISVDGGEQWMVFGDQLPATSVADLKLIEDKDYLIAASHGRGLYRMDLRPLRQMADIDQNRLHFFPIDSIEAPRRRATHKDVDRASLQPAHFYFWVPNAGSVNIEVHNDQDQVIWKNSSSARQGLNHYNWDLISNTVESDEPYFIHYDNYLDKGAYKVKIGIEGQWAENTLILK